MPGVIIDRFGDIYAIQPNAAWSDRYFNAIYETLEVIVPLKTIIKNTSGQACKIEGLKDESALMKGKWREKPITIAKNGAI